MFCSACGSKIPDDSSFCNRCGISTSSANNNEKKGSIVELFLSVNDMGVMIQTFDKDFAIEFYNALCDRFVDKKKRIYTGEKESKHYVQYKPSFLSISNDNSMILFFEKFLISHNYVQTLNEVSVGEWSKTVHERKM